MGDVRAKGLMLAVELVEPGTTTPAPALAAHLQEEARRGGLLVGKGGLYGNVLRIAPPLILTEAEADEGLRLLAHALHHAGIAAPESKRSPRTGAGRSLPALVP